MARQALLSQHGERLRRTVVGRLNRKPRQDLADGYRNLGDVWLAAGPLAEAECVSRKALSIEKSLPSDFPAIPGTRYALGVATLIKVLLVGSKIPRLHAATGSTSLLAVYRSCVSRRSLKDRRCGNS